jgi:hypothetical protein
MPAASSSYPSKMCFFMLFYQENFGMAYMKCTWNKMSKTYEGKNYKIKNEFFI